MLPTITSQSPGNRQHSLLLFTIINFSVIKISPLRVCLVLDDAIQTHYIRDDVFEFRSIFIHPETLGEEKCQQRLLHLCKGQTGLCSPKSFAHKTHRLVVPTYAQVRMNETNSKKLYSPHSLSFTSYLITTKRFMFVQMISVSGILKSSPHVGFQNSTKRHQNR